jgi:cytochrome c-type biogenesis protein CcmH/NrfG
MQCMARLRLVFALLPLGVALLAAACSSHPPIPELPKIAATTFLPAVRQQVQQAYDDARQHPRDAAACGRLGMVLHAYEQYQSAAVCYRRASLLEPGSLRWTYS